MKKLLTLLCILVSMHAASADWNVTGTDGMLWGGNVTAEHFIETGDDDNNMLLGFGADHFNRADGTDIGSSWQEWDGQDCAEINNTQLRNTGAGSARNNVFKDISLSSSNYNMSFTLHCDNDGDISASAFRYAASFYVASYTVSVFQDEKYMFLIYPSLNQVRLYYYDGTTEHIVETITNKQINKSEVITIDTSTVDTGLQVYKDGESWCSFSIGNTSILNGTIGLMSYLGVTRFDNMRIWNTTTGNLTRNTFDGGAGNKTSKVRIQGNNPVAGANITVAINKSTDQSSWVWEELGTVTTIGDFNVTYDVAGDYRYAKWDFYAQTNNSSQTPVIYNGSLCYEAAGGAAGAPSITSYAPLGTIWPEVQDSQLFNVTVNQTTQCRWYVNGTLKQTNATPSLTHAYTNTSLNGSGCNVTAVCNNTNGTDTQTWLFEVGADSTSYIILSEDDTNLTCLIRWNVTHIGSNVTHWNTSYSNTTSGCTYYFNFDNDTEILNQTATSDDETLWFNSSTLLPTGIYYINGSCPHNYIVLYADEYALVNNWTTDQNFTQISVNISHDVCYSYYNHTSGLWESFMVGYTYNHAAIIPKNCSAFVFVDGATTITATPTTSGTTIQNASWFYGYLPGATSKTITEIETAMNSDGLDVWSLFGWHNATAAYTATGSYSVAPNEGYSVYCNVSGEYTP